MNAGYVRLSRDDDKRNYVSIENQKLIINQYASNNGMVIDRWYEDDGVSGYIFDRPGFRQMMADLDKDIDTVYVKDFSRLGRHNAKVLLLLDEFQERGKHLIVIDDNYDSFDSSDDTIGIKTWFNERYVKDTSKKIKRRHSYDKTAFRILPGYERQKYHQNRSQRGRIYQNGLRSLYLRIRLSQNSKLFDRPGYPNAFYGTARTRN